MLTLDVSDAIYRPLLASQTLAGEEFRAQATMLGSELEAVLAYLDLVQFHAQLDINADTLRRAEGLLTAAQNAKEAKLDRTAGDVERARTEVLFRRAERVDIEGRIGQASARLGRVLLLDPNVKLVPTDAAVMPVTLIDPQATVDELVSAAIATRPDLAANRAAITAAWQRTRATASAPLIPKVVLQNQGGVFGGGKNDDLQDFSSRNQLTLQVYWELKNFGLTYHADVAASRAVLDQAHFTLAESQARIVADIVDAAQIAAARYEALDLAEKAVRETAELYRINQEAIANVVDPKNLFDALRPLQAVQLLNQARQNYLAAVLDFTRAQYRLYTLTGHAPRVLMPTEPLAVPPH
jgi:outer membrane protein TolC